VAAVGVKGLTKTPCVVGCVLVGVALLTDGEVRAVGGVVVTGVVGRELAADVVTRGTAHRR